METISTAESVELAQQIAITRRYRDRADRNALERDNARNAMRNLWLDITLLAGDLLDNNAAPRAVDMARLVAIATKCLSENAADMTGDTTTGEYIAERLWESVGVRDYDDYITRAANGWPNDYGVKL